MNGCGCRGSNLQRSQHVAGGDAVDSNADAGPLNGKGGCKVSNASLRSVVGTAVIGSARRVVGRGARKGNLRLGLRDVDNGTRHAANEDDATWALAVHQMAGD